MNPGEDRWRRLEELFYAALELDPSARITLLDRECGGDSSLRQEIESLLASSDKTLGFLSRPIREAAAGLTDSVQREGQRIGPYRIEHLLGEGGMGTVYLATRDDESYQQQVALKLMHTGVGRNRQLLLRFSAERQILANLSHPNIARLLDGGMAPDGSPYLVMELIDGVPVDEYAAAHKLSIKERLLLFHTICGAVGYAHRNLIVHRDIKPANILVTRDGVPKLLDFGIAKLLHSSDGTHAGLTRATERLMTPEYASPEQVRGDAVSTATDVYALGTLLYQLLTGQPPFKIDTRNPVEVARIVCEQQPARPSTARRSGRVFSREVKTLRGDLDNIVLRALRKEPERRYSSAEAFAEDIQLYLQGYPIQAGSAAWTYRAEKFVRRHKLVVSAALIVTLAVLGFSIAMGVLAQRARRERMKAEREAQFLSSIFQAATPDVARGKPVLVRELLDQAAKRIDQELSSEPEVQAAMLDSVGRSYFSLGVYEQATPFLERAHALRQQTLGRNHPDVALTANVLGSLWEMRGDYLKAEAFFRESVAIDRDVLGERNPVTIDSMANLGEVLYYENRDAEAEPLLRRIIADAKVESQAGLSARNYLGLLLERKGAFEEAAQWLRQSAEVTKQLQGADSPDYATSLHNLAGALADLGDLPAAVEAEKEVLAIRRKVSGAHHPDLIYSLNNLGWFLLEEGNPAAAEPYLREGLELAQQTLGPTHPRVGIALNNWARVLQGKGDYAAAEKTYRQALAIFQSTNAGESWTAAKIISNLGLLQFDRGDFPGAKRFAQQALDMRLRLGGDTNPDVASSLLEIGVARLFDGNSAGARPPLERALEIRMKQLDPDHPRVIAAKTRLGMALIAQGELTKAEELLRQAVESGVRARHPLMLWQLAESESAMAASLAAQGRTVESEQLVRQAAGGLALHPQVPFRKQPFAVFRFPKNAVLRHAGV